MFERLKTWWHNESQPKFITQHVDESGQSVDEQGERLRQGDPLFDMLMGDDNPGGVHARKRADGTWDVTKFNDHEDGSD